MRLSIPLLLPVIAVPFASLLAGTNGILDGTVRDKKTGEPLPAVNVLLVDAQRGGVTDTNGYFALHNIRAGKYEVRFTHVGYQTFLIKNVIINPDLRTHLKVDLEPTEVRLEEVTVVQEKPLIQRDVTGTTYIVSGEDITLLPVDNAVDVMKLKAGVTTEGNVRGGKTTEVIYLVDGLPVQDVLSGGLSTSLPNSSIVGLSIYTGGFEAEYGNALSGVVNIVTRTGTDKHRFFVRGDRDRFGGETQTSKTDEFELSASGPLQEQKMYYVAALNGLYSHTRWWQDMELFFPGPIDKLLSGFGKVDYLFTPTFRLGAQVLFSDHDWRDYEFGWRYNLAGLPSERRTSYRLATMLSHSVSEDFFYTASLSRFSLSSKIGSGPKEAVPVNDPYQYDFFLRYIIDGQRALWSRSTQVSYTARFDGTFKAHREHLLKFGGEMTLYNLDADIVKFEPRVTYFGKPLINEPQLDFSSSYTYHPKAGAVYVQDKIDVPSEGILLNVGLRYDFLDPTANRPLIQAIPLSDTVAFNVSGTAPAHLKQQFSPRFGAAMQISETGYLFVNLGWYFQYPLFDYLYTGLDRVALSKGVSALTGNPDLDPERTKMWEISIKYSFAWDIVGSLTYFRKETTNLIDTKTFIPGDSKLAGNFGFAEYVNTPDADATGLELVISRERGNWITGEVSYTYMTAEGTSGSATDGFYIAQYGLPPGVRVFPLSWDQRHSFKTNATVFAPWNMNLNVAMEWHSGRPYTNYPTSTGFEPINGGRFYENNDRMPAYFNVDLKVEQHFGLGWWPNAALTAYLDVRNATNAQNVKWVDSNGKIGGELGDPSGYYIGRRTSLGVQVEF